MKPFMVVQIEGEELECVLVPLNHLEAMGCAMSLQAELDEDGLSGPQRDALEKMMQAFGQLFNRMNPGIRQNAPGRM